MTNNILFFISIFVGYGLALGFFRLFGKAGLYAWVSFAVVVANIEVIECVDLFGMAVTLGNVVYCTINLATDILSENWGEREGRRAVWLGFCSLFAAIVLVRLALLFTPNEYDFAAPALRTVFDVVPRVAVASLVSMLICNMLNTRLYALVSKHTTHIWLRSGVSTFTSQLIDSFLFTFAAFYGLFSLTVCLELSLTTFLLKGIIALFEIPSAYLGKRIYQLKQHSV